MARSLLTGFITAFLVSSAMPAEALAVAESEKPNIVLILADDLGYGDCEVYNPESKIRTPHIDRLAGEGVRFIDAHSASNTCTPSRYGLLTGINPARTGVRNTLLGRGNPIVDEGEVTIANLLRDQGYATRMIGKWHLGFQMKKTGGKPTFDFSRPILGGPIDRGFDYYYGIHASPGSNPLCYFKDRGVVEAPTERATFHSQGSGEKTARADIAPGFVQEEVSPNFCRDAVETIRKHAGNGEGRPLFLYYASPLPHTPWVPTERFKGKSGVGLYGDFVMQLDDVVGQINEALKRTGLDRSTILIFTSDNGPSPPAVKEMERFGHDSAGVLRGQKASAYEGGHRIPLIIKWPGRAPEDSVSKTTVNHTDFFATFAELLGVDPARTYAGSPVDSRSFLEALLAPSRRIPRPVMINTPRAIRDGDWKLVSGKRGADPAEMTESQFELFDLADDVSETKDLAETNPERKKALFDQFRRFTDDRKLK